MITDHVAVAKTNWSRFRAGFDTTVYMLPRIDKKATT